MSGSLTVLGSSGTWPEPGHACSGYLLEYEHHRLVLDLGYGTLTRLLTILGDSGARGLDAVHISHAHADHLIDLHGLFRARWFGARSEPALPVYAGAGVRDQLRSIELGDSGGEMTAPDDLDEVFEWRLEPAIDEPVGPWLMTDIELPHYLPNRGVRLRPRHEPGPTIAFTGDTGPSPLLAELGRDADLFIVECTDYPQIAKPKKTQLHLTARTAAAAAQAAGAKRLLLTHFWPGVDRERSAAEAQEHFSGEILVAQEGLVIDL